MVHVSAWESVKYIGRLIGLGGGTGGQKKQQIAQELFGWFQFGIM